MRTKIQWYLYENNDPSCKGYWILYQKTEKAYYKIAHSVFDVMAKRENAYAKGIIKKHRLNASEAGVMEECITSTKNGSTLNSTKLISEPKGKKILKHLKHQWKGRSNE